MSRTLLCRSNKAVFGSTFCNLRLMYDSVRAALFTSDTDRVWQALDNVREVTNMSTGEVYHTATLQNLYVTVREKIMVKVNGSFPKFHCGTNIELLSLSEMELAIERLSDMLHLDMSDARVTCLDATANLFMESPISNYMHLFGWHHSYVRSFIGTMANRSLLYRNTLRDIKLYDKVWEMMDKGETVSERLVDSNVLRTEIRFKRPAREFNMSSIPLSSLYDQNFTSIVKERLKKLLLLIPKLSSLRNLEAMKLTSIPDLNVILATIALQDHRNIELLLDRIALSNMTKSQKGRIRKRIRQYVNWEKTSDRNSLAAEIDEKITQF